MLGKDLLIYTSQYGTPNPIGCDVACTIILNAAEIITTTKGSGRSTNRELGVYDWQITSNNVLFESGSVITAGNFIDPIRTGTKVFIKASLDGTHQGSIFGRGVVTNLEITGQVEGYITAIVTIKADGQLYLPSDLQGTFGGLKSLTHTTTGTTTTYTSTSLHNKAVMFVVVDDIVLEPTTDYTFNPTYSGTEGRITFVSSIPTGKLIEVFYQ